MVWLGAFWHVVSVLAEVGPAAVLAGAVALLLAARLRPRPAPLPRGPRVTRGALRERSGRAGVPRHRDPDAAGRSRPRAPSAVHAAA